MCRGWGQQIFGGVATTGCSTCFAFCKSHDIGVSEQALGWFPLGLGLVMEDEPFIQRPRGSLFRKTPYKCECCGQMCLDNRICTVQSTLILSASFPGPLSAFQHWGKGGGWLETRLYIDYRKLNK